jgi:hypothetical protein
VSLESPPIPGNSPESRWEAEDYDVTDFDIGAPRAVRRRAQRVAKKNPDIIPAGWRRPQVNVVDAFRKRLGREPDEGELGRLRYIVKYTLQAFRAPINETTLEVGHAMLAYYLKDPSKGLPPKKYVEGVLGPRAQAVVQQHINEYKASHGGIFSKLNPAKIVSAIGDVVSTVAPFVDAAISLVPGAGQIYNAAKTAVNVGVSLAKGRPLTDAFIDGAVGMLPGGAAAQRAARAVVSLAKGRSLTGAMLDQVKEQFPGADKAITVAAGIAEGRRLQDIAMAEVKSLAADKIKGLRVPIPTRVLPKVPLPERNGFSIALGVMKRGKAITPVQTLAIRARLKPAARAGFDRALQMRLVKLARDGAPNVPRFSGVVVVLSEDPKKNGRQIAGKWLPATPGHGVRGTLVTGKSKRAGWWQRAA